MGWNHRDEDFRADHYRDTRKHEPRPGERGFEPPTRSEPPARLDAPLSGALEIAVLVKAMDDPRDGAALIERFVGAERERISLEAVAAGARP